MNRDLLVTEILRRNNRFIKGLIREYFNDFDEAEDVYQDLCIDILKRLRSENDTLLSRWENGAWLRVVTRNFCFDRIRSKKASNRINTVNYADDHAFIHAIFESSHHENDEISMFISTKEVDLVQAMSHLKEMDRTILLLRYFEKKSIREINAQLQLTNSSVYIDRAEKKLRKIIGELGDHDSFEIIGE
jgi:RNA polymerase sigma-70 factor (ECF subfamily)